MIQAVILFCIGLVLLIKGGDWFVDGAVGVAHKYRLPEILIGATIVSIGTTIPEVMVSSIAAAAGQSQTAYGNAIGSCICNTALIAAVTIAAKSVQEIDAKAFRTPIIFFFIAAIFYSAVAYITGEFSRLIGILLLAIFVIYMVITVRQALNNRVSVKVEEEEQEEKPMWKHILFLIGGAAINGSWYDLIWFNGAQTEYAEIIYTIDGKKRDTLKYDTTDMDIICINNPEKEYTINVSYYDKNGNKYE